MKKKPRNTSFGTVGKMTEDDKNALGGCLLFFLCAVCSVISYLWYNAQAPFEGSITGFHWDYAWDIEEYRAVNRECSTYGCYPEHSYNRREETSCSSVKSGDHTIRTCSTDYPYTINEWVVATTEHATGEGNRERPHYPELVLNRAYGTADCPTYLEAFSPQSPMLGCQRAGQQHPHHYYAIQTHSLERNFTDTCETGLGRWTELDVEDSVRGQYFSNRKRIDCASVEFGR